MQELQIISKIDEAKKYVEQYKGLIVTDVKKGKEVRSELNKIKKEINDRKIKIKKEIMKQLEPIEKEVKNFINFVDSIEKPIEQQIKDIEEEERKNKEVMIDEVKQTQIMTKGLYGVFADIPNSPKWLNKSYTMKNIEEDISYLVEQKYRNQTLYEKTKRQIEKHLDKLKDKYNLAEEITLDDIDFPEPTEEIIDIYALFDKAERIAEKIAGIQEKVTNEVETNLGKRKITVDVQEKKRYELEILASEEQYRTLIEWCKNNDIEILF